MTKISFIVVAYNAAQSLDALLGDLLAQTVDPRQLEALLVDSALPVFRLCLINIKRNTKMCANCMKKLRFR